MFRLFVPVVGEDLLDLRMQAQMRRDMFRNLQRLPYSYYDNNETGKIMSRMTNDVENVSNAVSQSIASLISSVLTLIGAFVMMVYYSWVMALIACITIPLTIMVSTNLAKFMRKYFVKRQKLIGALNGHVEEMVTSYKTVVAYGKEGKAVKDFTETSRELKKRNVDKKKKEREKKKVKNLIYMDYFS